MTAGRKLTASQGAREVLQRLHAGADPVKAASYQRYFKEPVAYLGLDKQGMEMIKQDFHEQIEGSWTIKDAVSFCKAMVRDEHMEARGFGYQVVARFIDEAPPGLLADIKGWLQRTCGNWGLVDNLAPSVLAPFLELHPDLIPEVVAWTESPSQWVRRGAAVGFVPLVTRKKFLPPAYRVATKLLGDDEDLIHKAVGWLLREAGKSDPARLERFLLKNGPKIPRTTVRYAIERFPKEDRQRLLVATRKNSQ